MRRDLKKIRDTKNRSILQNVKGERKTDAEKGPKNKPGIVNQEEQHLFDEEMQDAKDEIYVEDTHDPDIKSTPEKKEPEKKKPETEVPMDEISGKKKSKIVNEEEEIVNKKDI